MHNVCLQEKEKMSKKPSQTSMKTVIMAILLSHSKVTDTKGNFYTDRNIRSAYIKTV